MSKPGYGANREAHKNDRQMCQALDLIKSLAEDTTSIIYIEDVWRKDRHHNRKREVEVEEDVEDTWLARREENFLYRCENSKRLERAKQVKLMKALVEFVGVRLE